MASGWYVPADTDSSIVEQRILEAAARLPPHSAATAWASLRWRGGTFFDGLGEGGRLVLPVPLLLGSKLKADPRVELSREQLPPREIEPVDGLPCTCVERAVFDEMRRVGGLRRMVVVVEMAVAAKLTDVSRVVAYVATRPAWTGVIAVRKALPLVIDDSRSPPETLMRLHWELDAGFPRPICNQPVFDLSGNLLGYPDLFDPVAGVVGEYDGADHLERDRRRHDAAREQRFRDHGLEYFELVRGDLVHPGLVVQRMQSTRARARFLPPHLRTWTLEPPPWWR